MLRKKRSHEDINIDIINAAKNGNVDELKLCHVADLMEQINPAFHAAFECYQYEALKYLIDVCEGQDGSIDKLHHGGWDISYEFLDKAVELGKFDLAITILAKLYQRIGDFAELADVFAVIFEQENALWALETLWENGFRHSGYPTACVEWVCAYGELDLVKQFIEKYDINIRDHDELHDSLLAYVVQHSGNLDVIEYLVERGADLSYRSEIDAESLIELAIKHNLLELTEYLFHKIELGGTKAWVKADIKFSKIFSHACRYSGLSIVKFLYAKHKLYLERKLERNDIRRCIENNEHGLAIINYLIENEFEHLDEYFFEMLGRNLTEKKNELTEKEKIESLILFFQVLMLLKKDEPNKAQILECLKCISDSDIFDSCLENLFLGVNKSVAYQLNEKQKLFLLECLLENRNSKEAPFKDRWEFIALTFMSLANKCEEDPVARRIALYKAVLFMDAMIVIEDKPVEETRLRLCSFLCVLVDLKKGKNVTDNIKTLDEFLEIYSAELPGISEDIYNYFGKNEVFCLKSTFFKNASADTKISAKPENSEAQPQNAEPAAKKAKTIGLFKSFEGEAEEESKSFDLDEAFEFRGFN